MEQNVQQQIHQNKNLISVQGYSGINTAHTQVTHNGTTYIVQDLIKGTTLDKMTQTYLQLQKTVTNHESMEILTQGSTALYAMSEAGICHMDIKGENIIDIL